jgi:hypothetical protein
VEQSETQLSNSLDNGTQQVLKSPSAPQGHEPLEQGPYGAMLLAGIAVGLLFLGWLLFYFVLFMKRARQKNSWVDSGSGSFPSV